MPGAKCSDYYDKQLWRVLVVARGPEGQSLDKSTVFNSKYNGQKKKASVGGLWFVKGGTNVRVSAAGLAPWTTFFTADNDDRKEHTDVVQKLKSY